MFFQPSLRLLNGLYHSTKAGSVALDAVTGSYECSVDGGTSRAGSIEDVTCAYLQGHGWVWFEHLHHIELVIAQRSKVLGHRLIGHAVQPSRIDSFLAQVVLKAHPRRGNLRNGGKSQ